MNIWKDIRGIDWCAPQIEIAKKEHNDHIIDNIVMKFDKPGTAVAFTRWLKLCSKFNITVQEGVTPLDIRLVWHGPNLTNITYMNKQNAQNYVNEKTKLILIRDLISNPSQKNIPTTSDY